MNVPPWIKFLSKKEAEELRNSDKYIPLGKITTVTISSEFNENDDEV